jgi:hypothetical protein
MRVLRVSLAAAALAAALCGGSVAYAADAVGEWCQPLPGSSASATPCIVSPTTGECRCPEDPGLPQSVSN